MEIKVRDLKTRDIFFLSRIFKKMGVRKEVIGQAAEKAKDGQFNAMILGVDAIVTMFENLHLAEQEVMEFFADLVSLDKEGFADTGIAVSFEILKQLKEKPDIASFLSKLPA